MAQFFLDKKNNIFKYLDNKQYYLLMTGWDKLENKDRRYLKDELNNSKLVRINKNVANQKINEYWNSGIRTWEFNGVTYSNEGNYENAKYHKFLHTYNDRNGIEHSYYNRYKLVWHQGQLYWAIHYHYYPRIQLYKFIDLNTEPNDFVKWTSAKYCRGIVNYITKETFKCLDDTREAQTS